MTDDLTLYITGVEYKDKLKFKGKCAEEGTSMSKYMRPLIQKILNYVREHNKLPLLLIKHPNDE